MTRYWMAAVVMGMAMGSAAADSFGDMVQPILEQNCIGCHSGEEPKGNLRLDSLEAILSGGAGGPALTLGNPHESLLVQRILTPADLPGVMPPGDREKLSAEDILAISHWVSRASFESVGLPEPAAAPVEAAAPSEGPDGTPWVDYLTQIEPIFAESCYSCHGSQRQRGELRIDTAEGIAAGGELGVVLVAGDPDASSLFTRTILDHDDPEFMPQSGDPLTEPQIELLRRWIAQGGSFDSRVAPADTPVVASADDGEPWPEFTPRPASTIIEELTEIVPPYDEAALAAVQSTGALALPLARQSPLVRVDFQRIGRPLTGDDLALLAGLSEQVTWLSLGGTEVRDDDLAHVAKLVNLVRLDLSNTGITDAGLAHLANHGRLEYLNLYGTAVTDEGLQHLEGIATLRDVFVWQSGVTAAGVERLQGVIPDLVVELGAELVQNDSAK